MKEEEISLKDRIEVFSDDQNPESLKSSAKRKNSRAKNYFLDLRIQSPESLGVLGLGSLDTAPALIRLCRAKGIHVIGIADLFSAGFVDRIMLASEGSGVTAIPGVVIRCKVSACEDISLLCLFDNNYGTAQVEEFLRSIGVNDKDFGSKKLVLTTDLSEILTQIENRGAICIPTRLDKNPYSMLAIPELVEKYGFRTFDLCHPESAKMFKVGWPKTKFQFLSFSNASSLAQVGSRVAKMKLGSPAFLNIKDYLFERQT